MSVDAFSPTARAATCASFDAELASGVLSLPASSTISCFAQPTAGSAATASATAYPRVMFAVSLTMYHCLPGPPAH